MPEAATSTTQTTTTTPPAQTPPAETSKTDQGAAAKTETKSAATLAMLREKSQLQQQRAQLDADRKKFDEEAKQYAEWKKVAGEKNPLKLLQAAGLPADEVTKFLLSGGKPPDPKELKVAELEGKLSAHEQELQSIKKSHEERAKKEQETQREQVRTEVCEDLKARAAEFPWIDALEQGDMVFAELEDQVKKGTEPDLDAAAKIVNERLEKGMKEYVKKLVASPVARALIEAALSGEETTVADKKDESTETAGDKTATAIWRSLRDRADGSKKETAVEKKPPATAPKGPRTPNQIWTQMVRGG